MAEKKFTIIANAADIKKAIASIANRGAKLDNDIHTAAVSVLAHAAKHGDSTLADALVQALPKGARRNALIQMLLSYGTLVMVDKAVAKATGRMFQHDKTRQFDEAGAIANPWYNFKKEADPLTVFAADKAVQALLDKLTKAKANGLTVEGAEAALATAKALVAALEGAAD